MEAAIGAATVRLVQGDITQQQVDAIVNAANSALAGGGGVDGAIHRAAGPSVMAETQQRYPAGCPTGSAVITSAGMLRARHVIHAVGPRYRDGKSEEPQHLASAYRECLQLATEHACTSVALPALSMGAYGYPHDEAARIALTTVIEFVRHRGEPREVRFVLFGNPAFETFAAALRDLLREN